MKDLKTFFGTTFRVKEDRETKTIELTCVGIGYINVNKKVT